VVGTGHLSRGLPCQDSCKVTDGPIGSDIVFAVSDGAGSASHSEAAAKLAVELLVDEIRSANLAPDIDAQAWVKEVYKKIHLRLAEEAAKCGVPSQEFSCTLLGGYFSERASWVCQVGDGAIIASNAPGVYEPLTWPSSGEYANITTFVTSPDWETVFQFRSLRTSPTAVAAFTDGLQDLILINSNKSVHSGFFNPLFDRLLETADVSSLEGPLAQFLASKAIVERTDDDKTLVLICRRENSTEPINEDRSSA
jgi:hypothetical protein